MPNESTPTAGGPPRPTPGQPAQYHEPARDRDRGPARVTAAIVVDVRPSPGGAAAVDLVIFRPDGIGYARGVAWAAEPAPNVATPLPTPEAR